MVFLKGESVILHERIEGEERDAFGHPKNSYRYSVVDNVLIAPISWTQLNETIDLQTMKSTYQLAIPKGDRHDWSHARVSFWGKTYEVIGGIEEGMDALIPLDWNRKVTVQLCE